MTATATARRRRRPARARKLWPSRGRLAVAWIETFLIHGEGDLFGKPFRLLDEQKLFLWRWYEYRPDTLAWRYRQALKGEPRGGGKTEFLAAIACLEFAGPPVFQRVTPIIHVAAASRDNAGELFGQVQIMLGGQKGQEVREAPLCGQFEVYDTTVKYRGGKPGRIERLAAEASTNQGGKTTLFIADEVHEWTGRREEVHSVISSALEKRANTRELNITTAGPRKGSVPPEPGDGIAWRLYVKGLEAEREPERHPRFLFDWRSASSVEGLDDQETREAAIREASGSAAGTLWPVADRAEKWNAPEFRHADFLRYFLNVWPTIGVGSWLEEAPTAWQECRRPRLSRIEPGAEIVVGVDASLRHDTTSVTIVHPIDETRRAWRSRVFEAENGRVDLEALGAYLDELAGEYLVRALAYDPRFFELPAQLLESAGWPVVEVPQSPERMGRAGEAVYRQVTNRLIAHDGDPVLEAHVEAAKWNQGDRGRVLSKRRSSGPIDALIAGVIATYVLDVADGEEEEEPPDLAENVW